MRMAVAPAVLTQSFSIRVDRSVGGWSRNKKFLRSSTVTTACLGSTDNDVIIRRQANYSRSFFRKLQNYSFQPCRCLLSTATIRETSIGCDGDCDSRGATRRCLVCGRRGRCSCASIDRADVIARRRHREAGGSVVARLHCLFATTPMSEADVEAARTRASRSIMQTRIGFEEHYNTLMPPSADHSLAEAEHFEGVGLETPAHDNARPRLGLTALDQLAASALIADKTPAVLLELVRSCAESLAHDDSRERDAARVRLLSREIAIQKISLDLITHMLAKRIDASDERGALVMNKLANGFARRLQILCAEHRASSVAERQPNIVAIGHADHVRIESTE